MQGGASQSRKGLVARDGQDTRGRGDSRSPEAGLCRGFVVCERTGPCIGADDGDSVRLEQGPHEGPEAAVPPVGIRVVDHKIAPAGQLRGCRSSISSESTRKVLMAEGGKSQG